MRCLGQCFVTVNNYYLQKFNVKLYIHLNENSQHKATNKLITQKQKALVCDRE